MLHCDKYVRGKRACNLLMKRMSTQYFLFSCDAKGITAMNVKETKGKLECLLKD